MIDAHLKDFRGLEIDCNGLRKNHINAFKTALRLVNLGGSDIRIFSSSFKKLLKKEENESTKKKKAKCFSKNDKSK